MSVAGDSKERSLDEGRELVFICLYCAMWLKIFT